MPVPDNIRTQFSASTINTGMNAKEETHKESIYTDHTYTHTQDARAVNVVQKIKEGITHPDNNDDYLKAHDLRGLAKTSDLSSYVTEESLADTLEGYQEVE